MSGHTGENKLSTARQFALVATLSWAGFLNMSSVQSTIIMFPTIGEAFNIPVSRQQWISSSYSIALGSSLLFFGRIADMYPKHLVFICGCICMVSIGIAIPFAPNDVAFNVLRALQGLSASTMIPSAVGILGVTFLKQRNRQYAFAIYAAGSALGTVTGNVLAGVIDAYLSWKWVFWIIAMTRAVNALAALFVIPRQFVSAKKLGIDWVGSVIITVSFVLLLVGLAQGSSEHWKAWCITLLFVSIVLTVPFYFWERCEERTSKKAPLIHVSLFKNFRLISALIVTMAYYASFNGFQIFATYFYEDYQGLSTIETTERFLPSGVIGLVACFTAGKLLSTFSHFKICVFTLCCGVLYTILFATPIPPSTTYWAYLFPAMCLCASIDLFAPTMTLYIVGILPPEKQSLGGSFFTAANQLGRSIGPALATVVQTSVEQRPNTDTEKQLLLSFRAGQALNCGIVTAGLVIFVCALRNMDTRRSSA